MSAAAQFKGDYAPGGLTTRGKRRALARRNGRQGGLVSGVKRRQLARGRRLSRDGGLGVPKVYPPVPWLSREETERRFRALGVREGRRFHRGGYETVDAVYRVLKRWHCAKGQGFEITNEDISRALAKVGRRRERRMVQYVRARLVGMGIVRCDPVRRSGALKIAGQMDTVRIHLLRGRRGVSKDCTPLLRSTGNPPEGREVPSGTSTSPTLIPPASRAVPPDGGDQRQAPSAPATEEGEPEAQLSFETAHRQLFEAACRARASLGLGSPPPTRRGSDARCSER